MLTTFDIAMFVIGGVFLAAWIIFFFTGLKYADLFEGLEEKDYRFKEIYFVGYGILNYIKYQYKSKHTRKLRKELSVLYGGKYADYYVRVIFAQKVTISFTLLTLSFPIYGLTGELAGSFVMLMFAFVAYYYYGTIT
ncbi:MAG: pilus assembly protein TadC, partial [Lachnospiraceae bacterium]|nr:pilus assembly protein TadC [Lachnospiraceae bacterium]